MVLLVGVGGFARGGAFNAKYANKIMRLRLLAQFVAVVLIVLFVWLTTAGSRRWSSSTASTPAPATGARPRSATAAGCARTRSRVAAYGTVDELNATLGLARLHAAGDAETALERIQNDLFDLGADLCTPEFEGDAEAKHPRLRIVAGQVERLEAEIDAMNGDLRRSGASSCRAGARSRRTSTSAAPSAAGRSADR